MWDKEKGKHFKEIRKVAGYTQRKLANKMGYKSKNIVSLVETGRLNPSPNFRIKAFEAIRERLHNILMEEIFLNNLLIKELREELSEKIFKQEKEFE